MVRNRKRKSNRPMVAEDVMKRAVARVIAGEKIRKVALFENVNRQTLCRYVKLFKKSESEQKEAVYCGNFKTRQIFTPADELELSDYLIHRSRMCYGLTPVDVRKLAHELAEKNGKTVPGMWKQEQMAGKDWLYGFMKRHRELSLRKPEATSLSRATSFNERNVNEFFDKIQEVMNRYKFPAHAIFNLDETGVTTVQRPNRIVAETGVKQVGQVTSQERGTLVTVCAIINAIGNSIPPAVIFPRAHFKRNMISGCPVGTLGLAKPSGWMTTDNFLLVLGHLVSHVKCSAASPILLIFDNHETHVNIEVIDFCRSNGIVVVTFPPHCSHRLQPLDRTVYGPFKRYYNAGCDQWMTNHPATLMTIYDVGSVIGYAYPLAFTPSNLQAGFRVTGIYPFDRNIFTPADFLSSAVTNRPPPKSGNANPPTVMDLNDSIPLVNAADPSAGPSVDASDPPNAASAPSAGPSVDASDPPNAASAPSAGPSVEAAASTSGIVSYRPSDIRPFPTAGPRKTLGQRKSRPQGRTRILTDTPEKKELELKAAAQSSGKGKGKGKVVKKSSVKRSSSVKDKQDAKKGKYKQADSSDEEDWPCLVCCEPFVNSKSKEKWISCVQCKKWSHENCTDFCKGQIAYLCDNCRSEVEDDSD